MSLPERIIPRIGQEPASLVGTHVLPPPGGRLNDISFRNEKPEDPNEQWPQGDIRHQTQLAKLPQENTTTKTAPPSRYTKEQQKEWGYPEYDPKFDDPEWVKEHMRKEKEDPRVNPNLLLDPVKDAQEFWDNAARKPYAKAILQSEKHWKDRKGMWLQQYENVDLLNREREEVSEQLEECPMDMKRLIAPILKYRVVEMYLSNLNRDAKENQITLSSMLERDDVRSHLHDIRKQIDAGGDQAAEDMMKEFNHRAMKLIEEEHAQQKKQLKEKGPRYLDAVSLKSSISLGAKYKKDGLLEWEQGSYREAFLSWKDGHEALENVKYPAHQQKESEKLKDLHTSILKNMAQAAIKLERWNEALQAANEAIKLDDKDHKSWFRKACALEGLGKVGEMADCLDTIDELVAGRSDAARIRKDIDAKREKIEIIRDKEEANQKRMFQRAFLRGTWSDKRREVKDAQQAAAAGPPKVSWKVDKVPEITEDKRLKLTKDGVEDLLENLKDAYGEPSFQRQVEKLAVDVNYDPSEFVVYLRSVAFYAQKPVLEKWGFDPSEKGVLEMARAIQDHTKGDLQLRKKSEETFRALYGDMYDTARAPQVDPQVRAAKVAPTPNKGNKVDEDSDVD